MATVSIHIMRAKELTIKDVNSSDPFVRVYTGTETGDDYAFQSKCKSKTTSPAFNDKFRYTVTGNVKQVIFRIFDDDGMHGEDNMGTVVVPIHVGMDETGWYPVAPGEGDFFCSNASGELHVKITVTPSE
jgi:Ca2+-dependent lipid-binding protein